MVKSRTRHLRATELEEGTYQRDIKLKQNLVPEMKEKAKVLRNEMLRLEAELRARGGDPDAIEPRVPDDAISVDQCERPQFETNQSRRQTTLAFFRRLDQYKK